MTALFEIGLKSEKSSEFVEYSFDSSDFDMDYPLLMDKLRFASVYQSGKPNNNNDFMERLSQIPELTELITKRRSLGLRKRIREKLNHDPKPEAVTEELHVSKMPLNPPVSRVPPPKKKVKAPILHDVPLDLSKSEIGVGLVPCSRRVHNDITYRYYKSETQARNILFDSLVQVKTIDDLLGLGGAIKPWATPHSDAQNAINMSLPPGRGIPRLKSSNTRKRSSHGKPNVELERSLCGTRAWSPLLPDQPKGCKLADRLATTLGGTLNGSDQWCFTSHHIAIQFLMLYLICAAGNESFYDRLRLRAIRHARTGKGTGSGYYVVAYTVDGGGNAPPGTIGYFLLAERSESTTSREGKKLGLFIAFPNREHAEFLARTNSLPNKPKEKPPKRGEKSVLFVKLM